MSARPRSSPSGSPELSPVPRAGWGPERAHRRSPAGQSPHRARSPARLPSPMGTLGATRGRTGRPVRGLCSRLASALSNGARHWPVNLTKTLVPQCPSRRKKFFVKNTHLLTVFHLSVQNTKGPRNELSVRGCAGAQAAAALPDAPTLGTSPVRASAVPSHPEGRGPEAMPQAAACSSSHGNVSASLGTRDSCERITTGFPAPSSRRHVLAQL